jgi:hypothetical protein
MLSPFSTDVGRELGLERGTHATKLALDQFLGDALAAHSFGLDVELMVQVANACVRID